LSLIARRNGYVKPKINETLNLKIQKSRHPMIEELIETGKFVPNDVYLNNIDHQIILLTGPNMSGKSTFIRQVAIIVLLTQIGSYVPAESAEVGLVDRIFTRVGLEDDLSAGRSTFMTEMTETATILNEATSKSLIILDEIGRGTSTYDGLAIAMSVAEYIHEESSIGARTLFATHFFEMTALESRLKRLKNYHVKVLEDQERVIFLHQISKGISARSYGIYVASLAGMPDRVISKSKLLLSALEEKSYSSDLNHSNASTQLPLNLHENNYDEIRNIFNDIDMDNITPLEALIKLSDLKEKFKEKG
jgi:DNA mismatch repair protein MutS